MSRQSSQAQTLWWLHEQIGEIDRWRAELIRFPENRCVTTIEKLDAHREWLESQLACLGPRDSLQ